MHLISISLNYVKLNKYVSIYIDLFLLHMISLWLFHFCLQTDISVITLFCHNIVTHKICHLKLKLTITAVFHAWTFTFSLRIFTLWQTFSFLTRKYFVTSVFQQSFPSLKKILICRPVFYSVLYTFVHYTSSWKYGMYECLRLSKTDYAAISGFTSKIRIELTTPIHLYVIPTILCLSQQGQYHKKDIENPDWISPVIVTVFICHKCLTSMKMNSCMKKHLSDHGCHNEREAIKKRYRDCFYRKKIYFVIYIYIYIYIYKLGIHGYELECSRMLATVFIS